MSRAGRKRKFDGYKPGRHVDVPPDYRALMAMQPHRRDLPKDKQLGTGAVTELGRLHDKDIITDEEYLAGEEFARVAALYRATINPPKGLVGAKGGYQCDPEACALPHPPPCICAHRRAAYVVLSDVVIKCGHRVIVAVNRLVIEDQRMGDDRDLAIYGLASLARHLGLTERGRQ